MKSLTYIDVLSQMRRVSLRLKTSILTIATLIFVCLTVNAGAQPLPPSRIQGLEDAVDVAIRGGEVRRFNVDGHHFHIKPLSFRGDETGELIARGHLSHDLRGRRDDQVSYEVRIEGGAVRYAGITGIKRGGLGSIVDLPFPQLSDRLFELGGILLDGTWQGSARHIISVVATALAEEQQAALSNRPTRPATTRPIQPRPSGGSTGGADSPTTHVK